MKLPPFWTENIAAWFDQSKSQCCLKGVTSIKTKFDYRVKSMMQEVTVKVLNLIQNQLAKDPHSYLKNRLLQMIALNDYARCKDMTRLPLTGDMQPFTLMF